MILMISSQGDSLESHASPRFGRTPYFIKYDLDGQTWEALPNEAVNQSGGAGVAASQFLIDHKAETAISGRFGPNAHQALKSAGVRMLVFGSGSVTISDVLEAYQQERLEEIQ